jgi:hypothetical protein
MKAELLLHRHRVFDDGHIMEMTFWRVPQPVPPTAHGLKYSLFYGRPGARLIAYDNERGKGDHRHFLDREEPYQCRGVERLIADFLNDVREFRGEEVGHE